MGKITGWEKFNDISWKSEVTGALVQVVPAKTTGYTNKLRNGERVFEVYVESRNSPKHPRVKIPDIKTESIALKNAKTWMENHPNG